MVSAGGPARGLRGQAVRRAETVQGFWQACEDLGLAQAYVVAPVLEPYPLATNVEVVPPMLLPALAGKA